MLLRNPAKACAHVVVSLIDSLKDTKPLPNHAVGPCGAMYAAWEGLALVDTRNKLQQQVDDAVRLAKDRRWLVQVAERAQQAPESLSFEEIKRISAFVLDHKGCWDASKIQLFT